MAEWLQYQPHENCAEVATFLGWDTYRPEACLEESTADLPFRVDNITVQPGQWLLKTQDGVITVLDKKGN